MGRLNRMGIDEQIRDAELTEVQLRLFDEKLSEYQIIVINREDGSQEYVGNDREKVIYSENWGDHYNFIKSIMSYRVIREYCKYCNIGYKKNGCSKWQSPTYIQMMEHWTDVLIVDLNSNLSNAMTVIKRHFARRVLSELWILKVF